MRQLRQCLVLMLALVVSASSAACAGSGVPTSSTPISTNAALGDVGESMGSGQATETTSGTNNFHPLSVNLIGMRSARVRVNSTAGEPVMEVDADGLGDGTYHLDNATFGVRVGDRSANPSGSSGGGAASGVGESERGDSTSGVRQSNGERLSPPVQPGAPTPPTPPVQPTQPPE